MARMTGGGAAPLSGGGQQLTPEQVAAQYSSRYGFVQPQVPDPRRDVQASVGQLPRVVPSDVNAGIPAMLDPSANIQSIEDVAGYSGTDLAPATRQPAVDENGMVIPSESEGGGARMSSIGVSAFDQSLIDEQGGFADIRDPMKRMSENPELNTQEALQDIFQIRQDAARQDGNARMISKATDFDSYKDAVSYVDKAGSPLGTAIVSAQETLVTNRTHAAAYVDPNTGTVMPVGLAVLSERNMLTDENVQVMSTVAAIGLSQAISQIGVHNENNSKAGELPTNNQLPGERDFMSNVINATASFMKNGFKNMGFQIDSKGTELLAKAMVWDAASRGDLIYSVDPDTGNAVLQASPIKKEQAKLLQRASEAMLGMTNRMPSSSTPNAGGTSFRAGRPELTKKSLYAAGITTSAADATKHYMGSIAYVFRPKDLQRKMLEIQMMFDEKFVVTGDLGEFQYSTHPLAKHNGIDEGAWLAAKHKVEVPAKYDKDNTLHQQAYAKIQIDKAQKVMEAKKADIEFTMKSISNKAGLRYGHFTHSTANQRFFVNSYDLDWMGSKGIIRDVLGMAYQDTVKADTLFDKNEVRRVQEKARSVYLNKGDALHKALEKLTPNEIGAMGAMHSAVVYYYTAIDSKHELSQGITRRVPGEIISMYTPEIGSKLAELGDKYNAFLKNPTSEPDPEMMRFWAGTEKGEAMGSMNLMDDFYQAKLKAIDPKQAKSSVPMTHHAFYDGNQNGIFLQALLFGMESASSNGDAIIRLSSPNPTLLDMRQMGMNTLLQTQDNVLSSQGESDKQDAWKKFWTEAEDKHPEGMAGVAKDFFKEPLMQNAYGKDASMFSDVMFRLLEANRLYSDLFKKHLQDTGIYNDATSAAQQLSEVVEVTLRQIIDSGSVSVLKKGGRYSALVNSAIHVEGPSGDTMVIAPVGMAPVNKKHGNPGAITYQEINGKRVLRKTPSYVTDTITDPATGESIDIPSYELQQMPSASVGTVMHLNRATMKYDPFDNPFGMSLSRQLGVLLVQSLDGDLVKWATIETNKGRDIPRPVMWVHDSIISTPGHGLIYNNMYNNIGIPSMIPKLKPMAKKIRAAIRENIRRETELVMARGEPVGIGPEGEYPALGALFDDYAGKIDVDNPRYKEIFIRMAKTRQAGRKAYANVNKQFESMIGVTEDKSPEAQWDKYRENVNAILKEAEAAGWVDPGDFPPGDRKGHRFLAVTPAQFKKLVRIGGELLQMEGATNRLDHWAEHGEQRVTNAEKVYHTHTKPGGVQMAASAAKASGPYDPKALPPEERASYKAEQRKLNDQAILREKAERQARRDAERSGKVASDFDTPPNEFLEGVVEDYQAKDPKDRRYPKDRQTNWDDEAPFK